MKRFMSVFLVLGVVLAATHAVAASQAYPKTQAALEQEFMNMPWEAEPGSYTLSTSNSQIDLPPGFAVLRGDPARRFMFLTQGAEKNETEAVIANPDNGTQLILSYHETGYIESDDWNELDTGALLTTIMDKTEADNANRAEHQLPQLTINDWLQEPTFHAGDNSVSWALDITEGNDRIANAIVLRLGRKGFERLTWVGTYQQYKTAGHSIDTFRNGHHFQDGLRYADFSAGDGLAGFGIASLVAVMAGGGNGHQGPAGGGAGVPQKTVGADRRGPGRGGGVSAPVFRRRGAGAGDPEKLPHPETVRVKPRLLLSECRRGSGGGVPECTGRRRPAPPAEAAGCCSWRT